MMSDPRDDLTTGRSAHRAGTDFPFFACFIAMASAYVLLIVAMLFADTSFTSFDDISRALHDKNIQFSITLSLISCSLSAVFSTLVAVPVGYLIARFNFRGKNIIDAILDIPIVLPPLVVGLSLLILFQTAPGKAFEKWFVYAIDWLHVNNLLGQFGVRPIRGITFELPSVILAQFSVACAFAVRTMRVTFDQIDPRHERVALTLGCRRSQAFFRVVLPEAWPGVITAGTLAWARSMGEFGPILVFAGATRMKPEVLPTTVFLELSLGDLEAAVAVSLIMVTVAMIVLVVARSFGLSKAIL